MMSVLTTRGRVCGQESARLRAHDDDDDDEGEREAGGGEGDKIRNSPLNAAREEKAPELGRKREDGVKRECALRDLLGGTQVRTDEEGKGKASLSAGASYFSLTLAPSCGLSPIIIPLSPSSGAPLVSAAAIPFTSSESQFTTPASASQGQGRPAGQAAIGARSLASSLARRLARRNMSRTLKYSPGLGDRRRGEGRSGLRSQKQRVRKDR